MELLIQRIKSTTGSGWFIGFFLVGVVMGNAIPAAAQLSEEDITKEEVLADIKYDMEHPRVWHTLEEVRRARRNAATTEWGREVKERILADAQTVPKSREDSFLEMSADEIRTLAPITAPDGKTYFAFPGKKSFESVSNGSVCPIDGTSLNIAGFDQPGKLKCEEGHIFPNDEFPDLGEGWVAGDVPENWAVAAARDSTKFWFAALYNGWIAKHMEEALEPLAYAYVLTQEPQYARTAAAIFDVLASAYHRSQGRIFAYPSLTLGKLQRPGYQVGRALRDFTNAADLMWNSEPFNAESQEAPGLTVKEHVARHMMADGADFIWHYMRGGMRGISKANYARIFHNGTGDYNEGLLSVSSLLGLDVGYVHWALDGPVSLRNFLTNTVYRDGQYYETAAPNYGPESFFSWSELAYHVQNAAYPEGVNFYDQPRFINLNISGPMRFNVAGRMPYYGDGGRPDIEVYPEPSPGEFRRVLRYYVRTGDEEKRGRYAQLLAEIAGGNPNERLNSTWALFNVDREITGYDLSQIESEPRDSELLPGKGFVMYRPETGFDRGAVMRYGPTLSHGHSDGLGLHIYGAGRELSYDPGHLPKRHMLNSFLRQTAAHNTVVVNETSLGPPEDDGGSLRYFVDRSGYTVADVANAQAYVHENVDTYRRTIAFIDTSPEQSYLVDIFRVAGANTTDYSFHGQGVQFDTDLSLSGPAEGSVASSDYCWGDQIRQSGEIAGFEQKQMWFTAKPGNGYGMLCSPRRAAGDQIWSATWSVDERRGSPARLRLTMLPDEDREVIVANAPDPLVWNLGLDHTQHDLKYLLARDRKPRAQYVAVIEPTAEAFPIEDVERLQITQQTREGSFAPVAFKVTHADGQTTDYFLSSFTGRSFTAETDVGAITTDAAFAMVRAGSEGIEVVRFEKGTELRLHFEDQTFTAGSPTRAYTGRVLEVDDENSSLLVTGEIPVGDRLQGQQVLIDAPEYSHNSPYAIQRIEAEGENRRIYLQETSMVLSRGTVDAVAGDTLASPADFPFVWTRSWFVPGGGSNTYFDGKKVVNLEDGSETIVKSVDSSHRRLIVAETSGFQVDDIFKVMDVKAGDRFSIPLSVEIRRSGDRYVTQASETVEVKVSSGGGAQ